MNKEINHGVMWSLGSRFSDYTISLIFTSILARIVLPEHYGLFNMVSTVTAFFMIFADGGLAWSIVQKKYISDEAVSNLFWINAALGCFMALICLLISPFLAKFYGYEELTNLTALMSVNFILTGLTVSGTAWLKRQLKLPAIAIINIVALLAAGIAGLYAAHTGMGYWSLAIQSVVKSSITMVGVFSVARMPLQFYCKNTPMLEMLKFSSGLLGFGAINYFSRNLDSILIAKYLGARDLAFYAKAYFIITLPSMLITGALMGLMVSVLSKYQDDNFLFHTYYKRSLRLIALLSFPIAGYFFAFPDDIILLLYGNNWVDVVPLIRILSIACLTQPLYSTMGWIFIATGNTRFMLYFGIFSTIILSFSFLVGIKWGVTGVAWSYSLVAGILSSFSALAYSHHVAGISLTETFHYLIPVTLISSASLVFTWWVSIYQIGDMGLLMNIMIRCSLIASTLLIFLTVFYRTNILNLLNILDES